MTAQTLIDQITRLIEAELRALDRATQQNHLSVRRSVLAGSRSMWDKAAVHAPKVSIETGSIQYVSYTEAMKYGRYEKLTKDVNGIVRRGMLTDISNLEYHGKRVYELQYNGMAWVYQQGYGLPITGGVKVPLVAQAVYSDFYGRAFDATLRKNWALYADDIMAAVTRELRQGHSYTQLAKVIQDRTDRSYSDSLRVAQTEAARIQAMAREDTLGLLDEAGVEYKKYWISTIDSATREDHQQMDGEFADANGIFHLPSGASGPEPTLTGSPGDDINCRCTSGTTIDGQRPEERRIRGEGIVPYETYAQRLERKADIPLTALRRAR